MQISIERTNSAHEAIVQRIFEQTPEFFLRTDHSVVLPGFANREMNDCPPKEKQSSSYEKVFCLAYLDGQPIGVIDIHRDHPASGVSYIGLLLIEGPQHNRGLGRAVYQAAERFIASTLKSSSIRLGVSRDNDVELFWRKMGFARNGRTYKWPGTSHVNKVFEMEKAII